MAARCPVLVLPGLGAGDGSTIAIRTQLRFAGHITHPWNQGRNDANFAEILPALTSRFLDLADRHRGEVAVVGWSLGGIYACHLATSFPALVRQVVTLGSPLRSSTDAHPSNSEPSNSGPSNSGPSSSVPLTSIWTRTDRVVPWRRSAIEPSDRAENIEVRATHMTLGFDPFVLGAIVDRLAQDPADWRPFRPAPWLRAAYPRPVGS